MSEQITWEDVAAVCKVMGVEYEYDAEFKDFSVHRYGAELGATFTNPIDALDFISAEQHFLETKYANILRTKP